ncbi:unnamed protein product [Symbiodinium sp. CCMP2592]|nr:unnamed protein product [Symbiodinium sp. CCMP2592]
MVDTCSLLASWAADVWTHVSTEFETLKGKSPPGQTEGAIGQAFHVEKILSALKGSSREIRNVAGNIAWVKPLNESIEGDSMSMEQIQRYAATVFMNADGKVQAPRLWPTGVTIPVAMMQLEEMPAKGWDRYGADVAVAAYWYAFAQAKKQGSTETELQTWRALGRNVPMTFRFFPNEDAKFAAATEVVESVENNREFFGMDMTRLIAVVVKASKIVAALGTKAVQNKDISDWLQSNIKWHDPKRCPSANTVGQLTTIGESLAAAPRARAAVQAARVHLGRDTIFDEYSKVLIVVQRCDGPEEFSFVCEFLLMKLLRGKSGWSQAELKAKAGDVSFAIFAKRYGEYIHSLLKKCCARFPRGEAIFSSPWAFHKEFPLTEVPDLSWMGGMPRLLILAVTHFSVQPAHAKNLGKLKSFWADFDLQLGEKQQEKKEEVEKKDVDQEEKEKKAAELKDTLDKLRGDTERMATEILSVEVVILEQQAPAAAQLLALVQAQEMAKSDRPFMAVYDPKTAAVTKPYPGHSKWQRLPVLEEADFKEFTKSVHDMKLGSHDCSLSLPQRPSVSVLLAPRMTPGRDVIFIFSGKVKSNEDAILKQARALKWSGKEFYLHYDPRQMAENGYFARMRGLANAGTAEKLFLFWKGQVPKDFKKNRMFVDPGSATYMDSILRVPVAAAREHGLVSTSIYELWDKADGTTPGSSSMTDPSMAVATSAADGGEGENATNPDAQAEEKLRKRKYTKRGRALTRAPSTDEVVLFPHDMAGALMKEMVHESNAQFVLLGTPGMGSGIYACLEMKTPVIAIVKTQLHKKELLRVVKERLVSELPVTGATLACCDLVKRAEALGMVPTPKKKAKAVKPTPEDDDAEMEEEDDDHDESLGEPDEEASTVESEKKPRKSKKKKDKKDKKSKKSKK